MHNPFVTFAATVALLALSIPAAPPRVDPGPFAGDFDVSLTFTIYSAKVGGKTPYDDVKTSKTFVGTLTCTDDGPGAFAGHLTMMGTLANKKDPNETLPLDLTGERSGKNFTALSFGGLGTLVTTGDGAEFLLLMNGRISISKDQVTKFGGVGVSLGDTGETSNVVKITGKRAKP